MPVCSRERPDICSKRVTGFALDPGKERKMAWLSHFWDRPWNRFLNPVNSVWHGGLRLQPLSRAGP